MARYYLSAVEYIKKKNFDVWVPAFYFSHLPEDMKNPKPEPLQRATPWKMTPTKQKSKVPFRQIIDPNQLQKASYSIEIMLDMFSKKVEFKIAKEDDIPEIFDALDRYLVSLQHDVELGNTRVTEYARLVIKWREQVYKHYYRYMKTHPAALEKLYPNNDPNKNLLSLMNRAGGNRLGFGNMDPLRARAIPPYQIDRIKPNDPEEFTSADLMMEKSLGIGSSPGKQDENFDFNIDDFLKKG